MQEGLLALLLRLGERKCSGGTFYIQVVKRMGKATIERVRDAHERTKEFDFDTRYLTLKRAHCWKMIFVNYDLGQTPVVFQRPVALNLCPGFPQPQR
ncbi:MAG: hypothetical protein CM1200mP36_05030 [Gammaproteobacteria bacterium]|nr:MAG: hypothetical protein CM1200mP36_05030 [Gammaproteobacteria bacterium]